MPLPSSRRSTVTRTAAITRRPADARGFALLITITLLAFLVLLLVSLASLTRVETQVASNTQQLATARQNALLALNVALGQLQQAAGPDQRVTATADLLPATHPSKKNWTGVWNTSNPANNPSGLTPGTLPAPTWLVSGTTPSNAGAAPTLAAGIDSDGSHVRLVGPATTKTAAAGNEIIVRLQDINAPAGAVPGLDSTATPVVARIGYWVGDEGVKARIDLDDPKTARTATTTGSPALPANPSTDTEKRQSLMVAGRTGGELLATATTPAPAPLPSAAYLGDSSGAYEYTGPSSASSANFRRDLAKLTSLQQASLLGTDFTPDFLKRRFHDITVHSQGVLADVANGGLKKDLTAGLQGSAPYPAGLSDTDTLFKLSSPAGAELGVNTPTNVLQTTGNPATATLPVVASGIVPSQFPTWGTLRSYVQLQNSLSGAAPSIAPRSQTDTRMGLSPVIAYYHIWYRVARQPNGSVRILYFPAVALWNPYDVPISGQRYAMKVSWSMPDYTNQNGSPPLFPTTSQLSPADPGYNLYRWPKVLVEYGPPAGPATKAFVRGGTFHGDPLIITDSTAYSKGATSKGFVLDGRSMDIPPGKSLLFTPSSTRRYDTAMPTDLVLTPQFRANFWWEQVAEPTASLTSSLPALLPATDTDIKRIVFLPRNTGELTLVLHDYPNSAAFTSATSRDGGTPTGNLLMGIYRRNIWFGGPQAGVNKNPSVPSPTDPATIARDVPMTVALGTAGDTIHTLVAAFLAANTTEIPPTPPSSYIDIYPKIAGGFIALKMGQQTSSSPGGDNRSGTRWLAQYNPTALFLSRTAVENQASTTPGYDNPNYQKNSATTWGAGGGTFNLTTDASGFMPIGYDQFATSFTRLVLKHLPRRETGVLSVGALQHANLAPFNGVGTTYASGNPPGYAAGATPTYAIGNSFSDPRVEQSLPGGFAHDWVPGAWATLSVTSTNTRRFHFDLSLWANRVLWDRYYFSTVPPADPIPVKTGGVLDLPNPRHTLYDPANQGVSGLSTSLKNYDQAAANLTVKGAFNVNSTSREAWRAVLAGTRLAPVIKADGSTDFSLPNQRTPFPRMPLPVNDKLNGAVSNSDSSNPGFYDGYRSLTDQQIDSLASQIVAENKARAADGGYGPYRSLADFVNRRPAAPTAAYQSVGAMQAAIDAAGLNDAAGAVLTAGTGSTPASNTAQFDASYPGDNRRLLKNQVVGKINAAAPGYLLQGDILQALGPVLSVRSDTFRIRAYGEVVDPLDSTQVKSKAWCEVIVQRTPDYVDQSDPALPASGLGQATPPAAVNTVNQTLGRRFKIISMRWLSPSDL